MSVSFITQRLADMYALIPGITTGYAFVPRILTPSALPAVIIEPGPATYDVSQVGEGNVLIEREYRATLFYDLAAFGTESQSETSLIALIDSIGLYFLGRPQLELDSQTEPKQVVFNAQLTRDSGFTIREYPTGSDTQKSFAAITFIHLVSDYQKVPYYD
jgi:hypothetical protein